MAYSKTTWQNNVTDIDANNLNKIEQGIYDNSLVVDAVTNTLNPTDTETYKTAELTEGQITDAIGVSDILIKGQTSQNGTPTPSAPVDVNVVSGSNVINTSNKNLLNINNAIAFRACTIQLQNDNIKIITDGTNNAIVRIPCVLTAGNYYLHFEGNANIVNVAFYNSNEEKIIANNPSSSKAITLSDNLAYIHINLSNVAGTYTLAFNKLYINLGSTDLSYEPHQGKELPLDLPVENLFDKDNVNYISAYINTNNNQFSTSNTVKTYYIPCKPNTTYTIQKILTAQFRVGTSENEPIVNGDALQAWANNNATQYTITTNSNANYLCICIHNSSTDTLLEETVLNTIQIEQGSKANAYTPYGTEPIELCKIGNYQDYFYKSGSKWYLHKEIEKKVLNGSEEWTLRSGSRFSVDIPSVDGDFISTALSNQYKFIENWDTHVATNYSFTVRNGTWGVNKARISLINTDYENVTQFKAGLATNNLIVYYQKISQLGGATDTEITDTNLISQLEAIYNAPLYEQTNITQTNNDLPMVLDITACKDNINGIKAFIRK